MDTVALFGIWASITGGFSTIQHISTRGAATDSDEQMIKAGVGVNIPGMVKLEVSGSKGGERTQANEIVRSLKLYQTPESLFHALRLELMKNNVLKTPTTYDDWTDVKPSDFVELRGIFRPSPVVESISVIHGGVKNFCPYFRSIRRVN